MIPNIRPLNDDVLAKLQQKIDTKTKPQGSLGLLENLALQIGYIQQTETPAITKPAALIFAADHGLTKTGVSAFPQEVTAQMVLNFISGGAAINVFCRQHDIQLNIVDAGVAADLSECGDHEQFVHAKIANGTANSAEEPAITSEQLESIFAHAKMLVDAHIEQGTNLFLFGEMGIGNTASASLIMHGLTGIPLKECVGKGTGLDDDGIQHKLKILSAVAQKHQLSSDEPLRVLKAVGGFEIAMMTAAMIYAAEKNCIVLVDGFISSAAALVAVHVRPQVLERCVFSHCSEEPGHQHMLNALGVVALLHLGMRLGEGSGAAVAYPLLQSAVRFLNEMASFESAGVSDKKEQ